MVNTYLLSNDRSKHYVDGEFLVKDVEEWKKGLKEMNFWKKNWNDGIQLKRPTEY